MTDHRPRTRRGFLAGASLGGIASLAGCIATGRGETETVAESIDPTEVDAVSVSTENGDLVVENTDGETGNVRVEKAAATASDLDAISVDVDLEGGVLSVDVEIDDDRTSLLLGPGPKADVDVGLPPDVSLARSRTTNGDVRVTDLQEAVDVGSTNGDVAVETTGETVVAETTNGDVDVRIDTAAVTAASTNGDVSVTASETLEATLTLSTTNGDVEVRGFDGLEDVSAESSVDRTIGSGTYDVDVETTNGDVTVEGTR